VGFLLSKRKLIFSIDLNTLVEKVNNSIPALRAWQQQLEWRRFHSNYPSLIEHKKPYKTPQELVHKLINEGLSVPDVPFAEKMICSNSYFRLKAYFIPFMDGNGSFKTNTTFNEIYDLYQADQMIRNFIFPILAILEVRMRAVIDNKITSSTKDPFWYLNPQNFNKYEDVRKALDKVEMRFSKIPQEFAVHHMRKYYTSKSFQYKRLPPFWVASEMFTIENLLCISKNINKNQFSKGVGVNELNDCAVEFGFNSYDALMTNLKCILAMRNIAAHHSRLWNRNLQAPNSINKRMRIKPTNQNRLYNNLVMLRIMCRSQGINDGIKNFFSNLITTYPIFNEQRQSMGFPDGWEKDPIWD
jgi:abortive infection bacteriophage resistance protein